MNIKDLLINSLLFIFSMLFILGISEVGIRIITNNVMIYDIEMHKYAKKLKRKSKLPGLTHEHKESSSAILMGVQIDLNKMGFRDSEVMPKKEKEHRIVLVGSSITMGWGVSKDSVFDLILEKKLTTDTLEYNVINTGIGNYNTKLQGIRFSSIIDKLNANTVVLHYFLNDAEEIVANDQNLLIKHSYLAAYVYVKVKQLFVTNSGKYSSIGEYYKSLYSKSSQGWVQAKESILKIKSKCENNNTRFILMVQPDLHDLGINSAQNDCHEIINTFAKNNNIEIVDLINNYRENLNIPQSIWVNHDDPHPNGKGHIIIGETLARHLKKNVLY